MVALTIIKDESLKEKVGVATLNGEVLLPPIYDEIIYYDKDRFIVRLHYKYAIIGSAQKIIVDFGEYDFIDGFVKGLARVKKDGKWGVINKYGYRFLAPKFDEIWKLREDMSTTRVIYQGEEFYLNIDKCPSEIQGTMEDYYRMSEVQVLFKYRDRTYKKLEYPEIEVYDWQEERRRKIEEAQKEREWKKEVRSMQLDAFEGDEELYSEWLEN